MDEDQGAEVLPFENFTDLYVEDPIVLLPLSSASRDKLNHTKLWDAAKQHAGAIPVPFYVSQ